MGWTVHTTKGGTRVEAYQRLTRLPAFHPTAIKLLAISGDADSALADFENIFKADPSLTADLLLIANSAAFGLRSQVENIRHALSLLGLERVRSLACNIAWRAHVRQLPREQLSPIWLHSIATAVIAERLGKVYRVSGLYTAGLLHDLGRLGLLLSSRKPHVECITTESADLQEAIERETALWGMSHCDAGALLALTWGFPEFLQLATLSHHSQSPVISDRPLGLIQVACRIADWLGFPEIQCQAPAELPLLPQRVTNAPELNEQSLRESIQQQTRLLNP